MGLHVKLSDGADGVHDCGMVIAKDEAASTVTVSTATVNAFAAMSTYVMLNIYVVKNLHIIGEGQYSSGYGTGDSKIIPANTTIRLVYTSSAYQVAPHEFAFQCEYTF